jgi:predicted dehydrogenase
LKNNQIGIVGVGYWATNIINTLEQIKFKNIHCYDISSSNILSLKKKFPYIKIYKNIDDLLKLNLLGVIITTNTQNHFLIAKKCLENNHNIFVEKPVTDSSLKIKKLIKLAKNKKKVFMSGYIYRYNVYIKYIKNILSQGTLGDINYVSFERANLGPVRNDISCIFDLASHDISTCIYFFKKNIKIIDAFGLTFLKKKIYDISTIILRANKTRVEIKSSWLNPEKIRKIIVVGSKKMLLFNEMDKDNPIKIYNKYAKYPKISSFQKKFFTPKANIYYGKTFSPSIKFTSPLTLEMLAFINCVKKKKKPETDGSLSLKIMTLLEKINIKIS